MMQLKRLISLSHISELFLHLLIGLSPLVFFWHIQRQITICFYKLPKIAFSQIIIWILAIITLFMLEKKYELLKNIKELLKRDRIFQLLLIFSGLSALSMFKAINKQESFFFSFQLLGYMVLYLLLLCQLDKNKLIRLAISASLSGLMISILSVMQIKGIILPFMLPIVGGTGGSVFGNKNMCAQFLVLVFPMSLFIFLHSISWLVHGDSKRGWCAAIFSSFCMGSILLALLCCMSRASWLAFIFSITILGLCLFFHFRKIYKNNILAYKRYILIAFSICVLCLFFGYFTHTLRPKGIWEHTKGAFKGALYPRYITYLNTVEMIKEHPLLGVGIGNFEYVYPLYHRAKKKDPVFNYNMVMAQTHNDYLQTASESGIPALISLILIFGLAIFYAFRNFPKSPLFFLLPLMGITGFATNAIFSFPKDFAVQNIYLFFYLAWVSYISKEKISINQATEGINKRWLYYSQIIAFGIFSFCVFYFSKALYTEYHATLCDAYYQAKAHPLAWQQIVKVEKHFGYFQHPYRFYFKASLVCDKLDKIEDEIYFLEKSLSYHPNYIHALTNLGIILATHGRHKQALPFFERLENIYPEGLSQSNAHFLMARCYFEVKDFSKAREHLLETKGMEKDPTYHYALGLCLYELGEFEEAEHALRKALGLAPNCERCLSALEKVLEKQGKRTKPD